MKHLIGLGKVLTIFGEGISNLQIKNVNPQEFFNISFKTQIQNKVLEVSRGVATSEDIETENETKC